MKSLLAQRSRFSIMQLANLDQLPLKGFSVTIAPMKLQGGSGGPTRVFAFVDQSDHRRHKHHHKQSNHHHQHQRMLEGQPSQDELCQDYHNMKLALIKQEAYSSAMSNVEPLISNLCFIVFANCILAKLFW